ncbi:MAG TPA: hypothetical protein DCL49_13300 [Candidatus Omnitrophica bacterium]|nr:hypothetical protein [Candidatus Omnitrophota bacterium]
MKSLIILDAPAPAGYIRSALVNSNAESADIFSLTDSITTLLEPGEKQDNRFILSYLDSVTLIGEQFEIVRAGINTWLVDIGESVVDTDKVKNWFVLPGCNLSTWWLSLLSEKNTLKTGIFLQIAQLRAINSLFQRNQYISCIIVISDSLMRQAVMSLASNFCNSIRIRTLRENKDFKVRIKNTLLEQGIVGNALLGIAFAFQFFRRGFLARRYLGSYRNRLPLNRALLLVTYSAVIEDCSKNADTLFHKYDPLLQKRIEDLNIPLVWILLYVPLRDRNFYNFIRRVKSFKQDFFIPEEFFTFRVFLKSLFLWARQLLISGYVFKRLDKTILFGKPVIKASDILIESLWKQSFTGAVGVSGIIHYFIFRELFAKVSLVSDCLYYCEMQSWEKALNAAKNYVSPHVRSIGFQHSTVPKNLLNLFCDQRETAVSGEASDLPMPDVLASNGQIPFSALLSSGYSGLVKVEATRYIYLNSIFSSTPLAREDRPVLLVIGSSDKAESRALLALVNIAFPEASTFEIWFKSHVCLPLGKIFKELKIEQKRAGYYLCDEAVSECLKHARVVLVPSSSVAIEALAFGCEVIIPFFPNSIAVNPLIDYSDFYHKVKTAKDLTEAVFRIINGYSLHTTDEYRAFVKNYWYLDNMLPRWEKILIGNNPLVSVIVATYNRACLISQSIKSILRQSYPYFELIVVSDGSTDETESRVLSFSDPRIRFIKLNHTGLPAVVRNLGIKESRGKYVAFCDDDDLWLQDKLAKQIAFMESYPDIGLCFGYATMFGDTRYKGVTSHSFRKKVTIFTFKKLFLFNAIPCLTVMVRKRCLEAVGFFDENPEFRQAAEDYDLWLRIARIYKVARIPEILSECRAHAGNISKDYSVTCMKYLKVIEKFSLQDAVDRHTAYKRKSNIYLLLGNAFLARNNYKYKEFYKKSIYYNLNIRSAALAVFTLLPKVPAFYLFVFCRKIKISLYRIKMCL